MHSFRGPVQPQGGVTCQPRAAPWVGTPITFQALNDLFSIAYRSHGLPIGKTSIKSRYMFCRAFDVLLCCQGGYFVQSIRRNFGGILVFDQAYYTTV